MSIPASISTNGETVFNGTVNNNAYSTITVQGNNLFNGLVNNSINGTIITGDSALADIENKTVFTNISNAGELNLNGSQDIVNILLNTGTVTTSGTTYFDDVKNNRNASITTSGTTTFNKLVDEGTVTLGGQSTL